MSEDLVNRIDAMLANVGAYATPGRDEAGGVSADAGGRVPVRVSLTVGCGPEARALVIPPSGEKLWFSAALVAGQVGVGVDELPGMKLTAVVESGELVRFTVA